MKKLAIPVQVIGLILGFYIGVYLMLIKPIYDVCVAYDNGNLTAVMFGVALLKCLFARKVSGIIVLIGLEVSFALDPEERARYILRNFKNKLL